jgi:hypothetical protein
MAAAAASSAFCLLLELLAPLSRHRAGPEPAHGLEEPYFSEIHALTSV